MMDKENRIRRCVGTPWSMIAWLVVVLLSTESFSLQAESQIIPDQNAPASQQAVVMSTASGIPQVNIQTPSSGGVSRNTYSQFDVDTAGVVLNNSQGDVHTQLAGWITGNPLLANGTARVILAEVNSVNPSYLNGYLEVAGAGAQVVIANPSGISCKGCGFINASRITLSTGQPIVSLGSLQGYRVLGGKIAIEGLGLDSGSATYSDIISRAVAINNQSQGGLFADKLSVITGLNQVSVDAAGTPSVITPLGVDSGQDAQPVFALDVALLGGMYAGKISLIGTEAGVGVRSLGEMGAGSGGLSLSVDGQLTNTGFIDSATLTKITASLIDNVGTGRIYGDHVALQAAGITNREDRDSGAVIAARDRLDIGTGILTNQEGALLLSGDELHIGGSLDSDHHATGFADEVNNFSADIESLGDMSILANSIINKDINAVIIEDQFVSTVTENLIQPFGSGAKYEAALLRVESKGFDGETRLRWVTRFFDQYTPELLAKDAWLPDVNLGACGAFGSSSLLINCHFETHPEVIYSRTDPIWTYFDLAQPTEKPATFADDEAYAAWQNSARTSYIELQQKINIRNAPLPVETDNWFEMNLTTAVTRDIFDLLTLKPSTIRSGMNLVLGGGFLNNKDSQVVVGSILTGNLSNFENDPTWGQKVTTISAPNDAIVLSHHIDRSGKDDRRGRQLVHYPRQVIEQQVDLSQSTKLTEQGMDPANLSSLPPNALFSENTTSPNKPLIETDPRFASYKQWFSSDYLLAALNLDPSTTAKRYGDGFYEQKLIREQVMGLTGYRYLPNYGDDEEQYKALLDSGVSYARQFSLTPGIALSAEQMAQLTSDMVWLVAQDVTLKDGSTLTVLTPKLYTRLRAGDLSNTGTLISANMIELRIDGDLTNLNLKSERTGSLKNSGTIVGRDVVMIDTQNVVNIGGLITGGEIAIAASNDIDIEGGRVVGEQGVGLTAGHDIKITTTTSKSENTMGLSSSNREDIDRVAGLYVTGEDGYLYAQAGNDVKLTAAQLRNMGKQGTAIIAGHDVNLDTVTKQDHLSLVQDANNYVKQGSKQDIGTSIQSVGQVMVDAGNTANIKAAAIHSDDDVTIHATNGMSITSGEDSSYLSSASKTKSKGTVGSKTKTSKVNTQTDDVIGTQMSGENISMSTDTGDITAFSAMLAAEGDVTLSATEGNVIITAEKETASKSIETTSKGTTKYSNHQEGYITEVASDSAIIAGGDIQMNAGSDIHITASKLTTETGVIRLGDTLMIQDERGNLKARDALQSTDNITIDTLALDSQTWNETQTGYRGIAKEFIKGAIFLINPTALASLGGSDINIKLGSYQSDKTQDTLQASSTITTQDLVANTTGDARFTSANLTVAGTTQMTGQRVIFDSALETHSEQHERGIETMSALGMKLNKDELRIAGIEMKDHSVTDTLTVEHHKAGSIATANLIISAQDGIDFLNQDVTVDTYNLNAGTGNVTIGGVEDTTTTTHTDKTETTTVSVGVKNAYVDAAYALDAVVKATEALKAAKDELSWAKREVASGRMAADVIHDYEINLAAATLNLTQANIAALASMKNAAQTAGSSAGTGFYVSGKAEHSTESNKNTSSQGIWNGSTFTASSGGTITGDTLGIQGSVANLGDVDVHVDKIDVTSGIEHTSSSSQYRVDTRTVTASSGAAAGSGGVAVNYNQADSSSKGTHHVNSVVNIGTLTGDINQLAIKGGDVTIDDQQAVIKAISVASEQDTQTSKNSSSGWSTDVGGGASGVSSGGGGISRSNGHGDSAMVNDQSSLIINKGADLDKAGVTKVTNIGGIIASGTRADDGSITDNGTLNYTGELIQQDIHDYSRNKQSGFNFSSSIGNSEEGKPPQGTTTIGVHNTGSQLEQTTKSVMGLGNVTGANNNRDVNDSQEVTKDQVTGALNATATIDNRWFTEVGRDSMIDDAKHFGENWQKAGDGLGRDLDMVGDASEEVLKILLPDGAAKGIADFSGGVANLLSIPSEENNGGIYSQLAQLVVRAKPLDAIMQSRDKDDVYAQANSDKYWLGSLIDGYSELEGVGRAILDNRLVATGIEYNDENKTYHQGINGMLNRDANIAVNQLEQNTNVSVYNIRNPAAVTTFAQPTHGGLADVLEAGVQKLNIVLNQYILKPLSYGVNAVTDSDINLRFAWDGDSRGATDYFANMKQVNGDLGALTATHSQGNEAAILALQTLGKGYFTGTETSYFFAPYGSPVNDRLMQSVIKEAGGEYVPQATNPQDYIAEGLGGNLSSGLSKLYIPIFSDLVPITLLTNAWDIPKLGGNKYAVYNISTKTTPLYIYNKPTPDAKPANTLSLHGGYSCSAKDKCNNDSFGGPIDPKYLDDDIEKEKIKLITKWW